MIGSKLNLDMLNKREIVFNFLCMPIVESEKKGIRIDNGKIETSQSYGSSFDHDMSDVAVEFYKIIYGIEFPKQEKSIEFVGDTMCSFNTIANRIPEAGKSKKQRTADDNWPDYLQKYYKFYHCLANFWILPTFIGRSYPAMPEEYRWASKTGFGDGKKIEDYMDRFLLFISKKNNYEKLTKQYPHYGKEFKDYDSFIKNHYLVGENNFVSCGKITSFSDNKNSPEKIIYEMKNLIKARAKAISYDDEIMLKIYDWYKSL